MKNETFEISIIDVNPDGNGIGHLPNGKIVFVPLTVPGDLCQIIIIKETTGYAVGKLLSIISPSANRVSSDCEVYSQCGSCNLCHASYEYELIKKRDIVYNALKRIGSIEVNVCSTIAVNEWNYRNKVIYPLSDNNGKTIAGYYARRSHRVIQHDICMLEDPLFNKIAMFHVKQSEKYHIPAWNEEKQGGVLRHLLLRKNTNGQFHVCMIASKRFKEEKIIAEELMQSFPIEGVCININPEKTNVILGTKTYLISGFESIQDIICNKTFKISPSSFYQINHDCAEKIYNDIRMSVQSNIPITILDLYCGIGTIGLSVKKHQDKLLGVEIVPGAIINAKQNALINDENPENVHFTCGDALEGLEACIERFGHPDVIIVDPPRKGLSDDLVDLILAEAPKTLVYLSCDPATLAFNTKKLISKFDICKVSPYNMFPKTGHVETLIIFKRKNVSRET